LGFSETDNKEVIISLVLWVGSIYTLAKCTYSVKGPT
jgi:hypothetical protein